MTEPRPDAFLVWLPVETLAENLESALARRAASAVANAARTLERSEVIVAAGRIVRSDHEMVTRCAWCDRLSLADRWLRVEDAPLFSRGDYSERMTHGICDECLERLERSGESRRRSQQFGRRR